jgi:hypothetical protein
MITRLLVSPVSATNDMPFAADPDCASVLRLYGVLPVLIALLPSDDAQTKTPGPAPEVRLFATTVSAACRMIRFTDDVEGFHTPRIGVVLEVSVIVFADSAVIVDPLLYTLPRNTCSANLPWSSCTKSSPPRPSRRNSSAPSATICGPALADASMARP